MTLSLQVCGRCQTVQYPQREVCGNCLSSALSWQDVAATGTVLSWTRGHISALPTFQDKVPLCIARIRLDAGPIVLAFSSDGVLSGDKTTLERRSGGALYSV